MTLASGLTSWCSDAIGNFNYQPTNLIISLLNEQHLPVTSWYVINAIPIEYAITGLHAEQSQILIESITLRYEYYKTLSLSAAVNVATGAVASLVGGSSSISIP
jgi:phage tail-like protein